MTTSAHSTPCNVLIIGGSGFLSGAVAPRWPEAPRSGPSPGDSGRAWTAP
ncbi:MAG: hypothetical protein R3A10_11875 [Caldilineaceae bacterium]